MKTCATCKWYEMPIMGTMGECDWGSEHEIPEVYRLAKITIDANTDATECDCYEEREA